jgi:four helix bundle protein
VVVADSEFRTFESLDCWKACREVRLFSKIVRQFPKEELFELVKHMKRTARSGTHNVAEAYGRFHYQESMKFCRNARGSLYELLDQFMTAHDEGFVPDMILREAKTLIERAVRLVNGYIRYLSNKKAEESGPPNQSNQPINESPT